MNNKALYQLERAVDALKLMAEALREEHNQNYDTISFSSSAVGARDVVFPTTWNDDVISLGGDIEINTGTEGNITFS
jgi:hypothetical protein